MGIPGFFSIIKEDYNAVRQVKKAFICDALYIDVSSIMHSCLGMCYKEQQVLDSMMEFIRCIMKVSIPSKFLYIAFDGAPPLGKLEEQASRRVKYSTGPGLSPSMISPGTEFMSKLTHDLVIPLKNLAKRSNIEIIVSSFSIKGEGEHKIYNHIINNAELNSVIYGLDADLIIIGLLSSIKSIKNLREIPKTRNESISKKRFEFVDINVLRKQILQRLSVTSNDYIFDIVLIYIILGNDFLPRPKNTTIFNDLHTIEGCLAQFYGNDKGNHLVNLNGDINADSFNKFINLVYEAEFRTYQRQFHINELMPDLSLANDQRKKFDEYRFDLYSKWDHKNSNEVNEIKDSYLEGLQWVLKYYLNGTSNEFIFPYKFVPFISDLKIKDKIKPIETEVIDLKPLHHLALISPSNSFLLPNAYKEFKFSLLAQPITFTEIKKQVDILTQLDSSLTKEEQNRNEILFQPLMIK